MSDILKSACTAGKGYDIFVVECPLFIMMSRSLSFPGDVCTHYNRMHLIYDTDLYDMPASMYKNATVWYI